MMTEKEIGSAVLREPSEGCEHIFVKLKVVCSRGWFRSTDLWVMGPARFLCATLLVAFRDLQLKYRKRRMADDAINIVSSSLYIFHKVR